MKEDSPPRPDIKQVKKLPVRGSDPADYPEITKKTIDGLVRREITKLFPIQIHCFYPIYYNEDLIARDLTGSGKTLAFAMPFVENCRKRGWFGQRQT